jgi:hypothetical protein
MEPNDRQNFNFLLASLKTVEDAVKNYDTKSQIVGVGYIFAINVVFTVGAMIPGHFELNLLTFALAWVITILPVILFGVVLYPTRRSAPKLKDRSTDVNHVFYVRSESAGGVREHLSCVQDSDLELEMSYEILKLSGLRDLKRIRFIRALFASAFGFFTVFLVQLLRVVDLVLF